MWVKEGRGIVKILVADDHELIREGLKGALAGRYPEAEILTADDANSVREHLGSHPGLTLAVLDLKMPGSDGFTLLAEVLHRQPSINAVVVSASEDTGDMVKAIDCGAVGYLTKSMTRNIMMTAIELVMAGGVYLPPALMKPNVQLPDASTRASGADEIVQLAQRVARLTDRQRDVLRYICLGKPNRAIAEELNISLHTVKNHVAGVLKALEVKNRTAAAMVAEQLGIGTPEGKS